MSNKLNVEGRLGILAGGGPAPGINAVIGAATIEAGHHGIEVLGIRDGAKWLTQGNAEHVCELDRDVVAGARLRGGCMLGMSRENPTGDEEEMHNVISVLDSLGIRYLVTIGGDDTAFTASQISERVGSHIKVAHVPKTIDNDLPLPGNAPTFGYNTAKHVGAELVGNLVEDARTTHRWYIVAAMGRSAGHLALGIGTSGGADLTVIPEEFSRPKLPMATLCEIIEGAQIKALTAGRNHGVVVLAEGIAELMKDELKDDPSVIVKHDQHNHPRLGEVPLAMIMARKLQERAKGNDVSFVHVTLGYELRCADPIAFDREYATHLGWGAVQFLLQIGERNWGQPGAMISIQSGEIVPIPFNKILDPRTGKTDVRSVNVYSDEYAAARSMMTRLERADLDTPQRLEKLAEVAGITPRDFQERFRHMVGK